MTSNDNIDASIRVGRWWVGGKHQAATKLLPMTWRDGDEQRWQGTSDRKQGK